MKGRNDFINEVSEHVPFDLNPNQNEALDEIYSFLFEGDPRSIFVLKGYAGTGKTTMMGALIRWFHSVNRKTVLLAPTGRSAKVLANVSGYPASTIHRRIYAVKENDFGQAMMTLVQNKSTKTIFIVDEASMIGERSSDSGFQGRSLLDDLIEYVYSSERCRLILIGDDAQLPPVGADLSPALDAKKLAVISHSAIYRTTLTQVVRQEQDSLILENATYLRSCIQDAQFNEVKLRCGRGLDVEMLDNYDLEDTLSRQFNSTNSDESVIICRSNKDANRFNQEIRARILFRENEIEGGDRLMIVKNNYHWKLPGKRQNFLANGDMISVNRVDRIETFGPFRFAHAQVCFSDEPDQSFDLILLLNSLDFEGPSIPGKELFAMREELINAGVVDSNDPEEKFYQSPYFQAVQVKYAYAITCHKSQGGQWETVLLYQGYFTDEMMDKSYFRWLYTAVTRATQKLYLVNFGDAFIDYD